jgi:hypothetical protein
VKCNGGLDELAGGISLYLFLSTYDHLKTHWNSPSCLAIDVTSSILNPESDKNSQIDSALLKRNNTAAYSKKKQEVLVPV